MQPITDVNPRQWAEIFKGWGEKPSKARLVSRALFRHRATDFDAMPEVAKPIRARLREMYYFPQLKVAEHLRATDGVQKFLFELPDGHKIESVFIPDVGRKAGKRTLCISSQVGCAMACDFCLTGKAGLTRNLQTWEIVEQVHAVSRLTGEMITHVVFMGMGEPLHNLDNVLRSIDALCSADGGALPEGRVTVSTSGLLPGLERLANETKVKLALTLSGADDATRSAIMPVNKKYPLATVIDTLKRLPLKKHREIFIEYVLLDGVNDGAQDAEKLAELFAEVPCKINLIPLNEAVGIPYRRPSRERVFEFLNPLRRRGLSASIRTPRGRDILAACGQLSNLPKEI